MRVVSVLGRCRNVFLDKRKLDRSFYFEILFLSAGLGFILLL